MSKEKVDINIVVICHVDSGSQVPPVSFSKSWEEEAAEMNKCSFQYE